MASFKCAVFLACLAAFSFAESAIASVSALGEPVAFSYNLNFSNLIPGVRYNSTITARWNVPDSALAALEGTTVVIKATAKADESSPLFFLSQDGSRSKEASAILSCSVIASACSGNSTLEAHIPVYIIATPNETGEYGLTLSYAAADGQEGADAISKIDLLQSLKDIFQQNSSGKGLNEAKSSGNGFLNLTGNLTDANFLDTLKPNGDSHDPIAFLKQNTLISIAALAIVVVITGAYLLNTKD